MFDYTIFLPDEDLLEEVQIQQEINKEDIFDEIITENEMLISIYDNQRFLIEQDTSVMKNIGYVNEGAFSSIIKLISSAIEKLQKLFRKFINFIRNRKNNDKAEDIQKNEEETAKKASAKAEEINKSVDNFYKKYEKSLDPDHIDETIQKAKQEIDNYKNKIESFKNNKKFSKITINKIFKFDDLKKACDLTIEAFNEINALFNDFKMNMNNTKYKNIENINSFNKKYSEKINEYRNVYGMKDCIKVEQNALTFDEYYKSNDFANIKKVFSEYDENIKSLTDNMKVLDRKCSDMHSTLREIDRKTRDAQTFYKNWTNQYAKKLYEATEDISYSFNTLLFTLTNITIGRNSFDTNSLRLAQLRNTLDTMEKELKKMEKGLKYKEDLKAKYSSQH